MFFWSKWKKERQHRLVMLSSVERELTDLIRPFPKVRLETRHEKKQSMFLIHQKREKGQGDLYSFAWMQIFWHPKMVFFSTREIHPEVRTCSIDEIRNPIREIKSFLEKYNTPKMFTLVVEE